MYDYNSSDSCTDDYYDSVTVSGVCSAGFSDKSGPGLEAGFYPYNSGYDSYHWTFGDGKSSTEERPQHTYDSAGT
jgi:hypothetical protein